uniref:Uncharacterized protein n=1 Tax=Nelumbo nucifera TaxID=4432 RepID=A0A822Z7V7_NELNU|nr:TPA_asm: hypothetical protein HUJ06_013770 [Nelumbo nucifera]DAD39469.1 TPA_asm: hypothetical protein HUJ06_013792 [Nelumbo nucifera]DAD39470.1 TPA_asm: hypothetical protein HUJ06_013793 [Nelumbo nucifera]
MDGSKLVSSPLPLKSSLSLTLGKFVFGPTTYKSLVGALQYITLNRPDLAYAMNWVCQFMHASTNEHFVVVMAFIDALPAFTNAN